jgi:hypothetical protein
MIIIHILQIGSDVEVIAEDTNAIRPKPGVAVNRLPLTLFESLADEWALFFQQAQELKASLPNDASVDQETFRRLKELGGTLAATLFRQENPFDNFDFSGPILFSVDRTIASLPYEALVVSGQFLCERGEVLRQVRSEVGHRVSENAKARSDGLLLYNLHHTDAVRRSVEDECQALQAILDRDDAGDWSGLDCTYARPGKILIELNQARWIHYAGHSTLGALELANGDRLEASAIANLNLGHVEAVFFNSCWSASQAGEIESLAMAFVRAGVRHLVGFNQKVPAHAAQFIGARFWDLFFSKGNSRGDVGRTITQLRGEIRKQFGDAELSWITLNHFGTGPAIASDTVATGMIGRRRSLTGAAYALSILGAMGIAAYLFHTTGTSGANETEQANQDFKASQPTIAAIPAASTPVRRADWNVPQSRPATDSTTALQEQEPPAPRRTRRPGLAGMLAYYEVGPDLGRLAEKFAGSDHPLYNTEEKLQVLEEILRSPANDAVKMARLRSELE